jgi:hypothetical protein
VLPYLIVQVTPVTPIRERLVLGAQAPRRSASRGELIALMPEPVVKAWGSVKRSIESRV